MLARLGLLCGSKLGPNLCSNPELSENTTGYTSYTATTTRVNSTVDPGVQSGGADVWCGKTVATAIGGRVYQAFSAVAGKRYRVSTLQYVPSSNTGVNAGALSVNNSGGYFAGLAVYNTQEDVWEELSFEFTAPGTETLYVIHISRTVETNSIIGDVIYFDKTEVREVL